MNPRSSILLYSVTFVQIVQQWPPVIPTVQKGSTPRFIGEEVWERKRIQLKVTRCPFCSLCSSFSKFSDFLVRNIKNSKCSEFICS